MITEFSSHPTKIEGPFTAYRAICKEVYDGDTYTMLVDLGFHTYATIRVRLRGVDTPEVDARDSIVKQAGITARESVRAVLLNQPCIIHTQKDTQSFNRWIADVYLVQPSGEIINIAGYLLESGLAAPYLN